MQVEAAAIGPTHTHRCKTRTFLLAACTARSPFSAISRYLAIPVMRLTLANSSTLLPISARMMLP